LTPEVVSCISGKAFKIPSINCSVEW